MCHGPKFATTGRPTSATQQSSTARLGSRVWLACVISTSMSLPKRSTAACANSKPCYQGPLFISRQSTECNSQNQPRVGWLAYPRRVKPYGTRRGSASDLTLDVQCGDRRWKRQFIGRSPLAIPLPGRSGVQTCTKLCVRVCSELDCEMACGWWTLRWDVGGDLSVVHPSERGLSTG